MKLSDYVEGAIQTESRIPPILVEWPSCQVRELDSRLVHGALGLATEAGEVLDVLKKTLFYGKYLDVSHLREEISDMMWYVAILCNTMNCDLEALAENAWACADLDTTVSFKSENWDGEGRMVEAGANAFMEAGAFLDLVLAGATEDCLKGTIKDVLEPMAVLVHFLGSTFEEEAQRNHDKLKTRYPEKFKRKNALNRDLDAEREAMEGLG